jgi:ribosomal-protein-alanine N-acetyltransferase
MSIVSRFLAPHSGGRVDAGGGVFIEPMRKRHLRDIMPIESRVYPKPWTPGVFVSEIDQMREGLRYYVVARHAGSLVGYAGLLLTGDEAHVTNIAVDPERHRRQIGTRLLLHLAHAARARGFRALTLEVRLSNTGAQELYRQFGFVPAGIRKRYYEDVEDAIVMWCHDIDTVDYANRLHSIESTLQDHDRD